MKDVGGVGHSRGRIVLLNGPSSAGKSSISHALAAALPTPWFELPLDLIGAVRADKDDDPEADVPALLRRTRAGYHRVLAEMAAAGNDVIADHVLSEPWRIRDLLDVCEGVDVLLVHVRCSADELARRERERGDRVVGAAARQLDLVFAHGDCDLEVDSTTRSPEDIATEIVALIANPPGNRAFSRLRGAVQ